MYGPYLSALRSLAAPQSSEAHVNVRAGLCQAARHGSRRRLRFEPILNSAVGSHRLRSQEDSPWQCGYGSLQRDAGMPVRQKTVPAADRVEPRRLHQLMPLWPWRGSSPASSGPPDVHPPEAAPALVAVVTMFIFIGVLKAFFHICLTACCRSVGVWLWHRARIAGAQRAWQNALQKPKHISAVCSMPMSHSMHVLHGSTHAKRRVRCATQTRAACLTCPLQNLQRAVPM